MKLSLLRGLLILDAAVLFLLGALLIFAPSQVERAFHFSDLPPAVGYMIGLWGCVFATLLAPVIASCISGALGSHNGPVAPLVALIGGGVAGIICGVMLGRRLGKSTGLKIFLGIILSLVMAIVCVGMSCFGCLAGGYQ